MHKNLIIGGLVIILILIVFFGDKGISLGGMPGAKVGSNTTSTAVAVTSASTQLLPANGNRNGVVFSMPSNATSTTWLSCGSAAVLGQGIELATSSLRYESNSGPILVCAWNAVAGNSSTTIGVFEY